MPFFSHFTQFFRRIYKFQGFFGPFLIPIAFVALLSYFFIFLPFWSEVSSALRPTGDCWLKMLQLHGHSVAFCNVHRRVGGVAVGATLLLDYHLASQKWPANFERTFFWKIYFFRIKINFFPVF
jgi:hypothetical protein